MHSVRWGGNWRPGSHPTTGQVGCHVQTGREGATYIGRQFTIAFIMVFVQDHGWSADPGPALTRLSGILAGIVVLAAVMLTTRRLPGA